MILEVKHLFSGYPGRRDVLRDVSMGVDEGEIVVLMGHNRAGKTTLLNSVFGLLKIQSGEVLYQNKRVDTPTMKVKSGISYCIQGQGILPSMSVMENLELAVLSLGIDAKQYQDRLNKVFSLFPILKERRSQRSGTMSGGQQRMLSLGMALMQSPKVLLLDEPSLGLSPMLIEEIFEVIKTMSYSLGMSILLVEQNVKYAVHLANRVYILKMGGIIFSGDSKVLSDHTELWKKL